MSAPLRDLWDAASAGDRSAFEVFYRRHTDRVFGYLLRRLAVREDARDLCLQVFIVAWERRERVSYSDTDDILPWLLTTGRNLSRNHVRSRSREARALRRLPRNRELDEINTSLDQLVSHDQAKAVLGMLRPRDRQIIKMCVLDEQSTADVASFLGISPQAASRRLGRALPRARSVYSALFGPASTSSAGGLDG